MAKYPILYPPDADDFFNMGLGPLTTSLTATVAEERNGSFIFEAEVLTDDAIYPLIEYNGIIKADAGHKLKDQRFRIKRVVPTEDGKAQIYAEHISYLSQELSMKPEVQIVSLDAIGAVAQWKNALNEPNQFVIDSDIKTVGSTNWRIDKFANPRQALGGVEGSLLDIYGGEYRFDNYHISLLKKRGTTANTVLAYGRNIKTFEQEENITSTYTSVYPYAIYRDENDEDVLLTIDGYTVHCANISSFPNPVVKVVDFSSEFDHEEIPTKAKLKSLAEAYIVANDFGVPSVSIKVSFVDLAKTADYAEYQALEEVNLCDDVRVIFPKLGVNTVAKVTRTVWNVLSESYDEIEIGERRASLSTIINDQGKQIGKAEENANNALVSANGKNTTFYGLYGPDGLGEPKANKIGDLWYKPNGDETEMYQWNGTVWEFIMSTAPDPELIQAIDDVGKEVEQAQSDSATALENANNAVSKANEASAKADQSQQTADQAKSDATNAAGKAQSALDSAATALEGVEGVKTDLATEVTRIDGQLSTKVETTVFNSLKGTVNSQGTQINQNTNDIKLKANQTEVDTIAGRVTSAESQLTVQAGKISGLTSLTDGHTTKIGALELQAGQFSLSLSNVQNDLNGLEIGGRNYAKNSDRKLELSNVTNNRNQLNGDVPYNLADLAGKVVTISAEIEVKNAQPQTSGGSFRIGCEATMPRTSGGTFYLGIWENLTAGQTIATKRISRTLTVPADVIASQSSGLHLYVQANGDYFRITKVKLGLGNKALDWSLAPEDQATVTALTEVKATVDSLTMTVADKADKTTVTQLANQWQQTTDLANGHTSQISSLGDAINLRVTQDQVDASILADKTILDTRDDNQPPSWYYANYPKRNVSELKRTSTIGLNDGSYAQLTSEVTWIDKSVPIKQTARTNSKTSQRFSTSETTWSAWSTIADSSNVVSQINVSSEGVLIAGNKIQILGNTYIESGVIKTAHIADAAITNAKIGSLSADKVTVGTLNGANVNIINLNANNIVSGEISGINIRAATFYGTSTSGTMQLNGTDLRFDTATNSFRLNYGGISNINNTYGTRNITFFSEGIEVASGASNTGNYKNSGVRVNGSTAYVDLFSSKSVTTTDYATRLVAETNGNFGVLNPKGLVYISSPAAINLQPGTSVNINKPLEMGGNNINGANNLIGSTNTGGSKVNMINVQGSGSSAYLNITSGSTSWGVTMWTSDMRLKTNIQKTPDNGLELVDQLMVRAFDWRDRDHHTDYGLIAQNVERVLPQAVFEVSQPQAESIKQISADGIIPVLVKAIQELKQEINTLKENA